MHGRIRRAEAHKAVGLAITLLILTLYCPKLWDYSDNRKSKGSVDIYLTEIEQLQT